MLNLNYTIDKLPGVGPAFKKTLSRLNLNTVTDLLYHIPFRYIDFRDKISIANARTGGLATFEGTIISIETRRSFKTRMQFTEALLEDETGTLKLVWFNQPYIADSVHAGDRVFVSGKVEQYKHLQLVNPVFEKAGLEGIKTGRLVPVYHLTQGLSNLRLLKLIHTAFGLAHITDWLPESIRKTFSLLSLEDSLNAIHYPPNHEAVGGGQFRLAVDDALPQQTAVLQKKREIAQATAPTLAVDLNLIKDFIKSLPFTLTDSQKRAAWDILQEMSEGKPMNRLLQGDVSSGKTVVAVIAALSTVRNKKQVVFLAPTEILARQHYITVREFLREQNVSIALLTRTFAEMNGEVLKKTELSKSIDKHQVQIIIGTHAVLQEHINIPQLGLVIVDEQHRFGVAQRGLLAKPNASGTTPHLLTMSATPIPRTLALSLYDTLSVSQLLHVPTNRKPILTELVAESKRSSVYKKITAEVATGRQVFIITPKVEESDTDAKSVKVEYERLRTKIFPNLRVGLVYGSMKGADKDAVMNDFAAGKYDILVATTVVEIGIDIPNATVMLIEGAEHFGLAQLHQLRGRVGRSEHQSYCYVFTSDDNTSDIPRLSIFAKNSDGFSLAEYDLKTRGFGELFGTEQSGFSFKFPQLVSVEALKTAHEIAKQLIQIDPTLTSFPDLQRATQRYSNNIHFE